MQIVRVMGGLGNQMFEAAFALAVARQLGVEVLLDLSSYGIKPSKNVDQREYLLDCYNVGFGQASMAQFQKCLAEEKIRVSYLPFFIRCFFNQPKYRITSNRIEEKHAGVYEEDIIKNTEDAVYEGYFQSEKYFKHIRDEVLEMFELKIPLDSENEKMLNDIRCENSVSLHVRRGDYLKLPKIYGLCSLDYYQNAIGYIAQNVENPHFFLFSDDIEWVVRNLKLDYPYTVVDINDNDKCYFDIELMRNCKHNIIANSSFSWWGAWLNENPKKIVVAPEKWFVAKGKPYDDVIPKDWVKMA